MPMISHVSIVCNGKRYEIVDKIKKGKHCFFVSRCGKHIQKIPSQKIELQCSECSKRRQVKYRAGMFRETKPRLCLSCKNKGENNPAYGKPWEDYLANAVGKEQAEKYIQEFSDRQRIRMSGKGNPMHGRSLFDSWAEKHGEKGAQKILGEYKKNMSAVTSGERNGFYGKTHSKDSVKKIKEENKNYREKNPEKFQQRYLKGLTKEKLERRWKRYKEDPNYSQSDAAKGLKVDPRTFKSRLVYFGIATKEEIREVAASKRLGYTTSEPERKLVKLLVEAFGQGSVETQKLVQGKSYDACLFGKILVEYDGYFWHSTDSAREKDEEKDNIARENGFILIRVKENEKRKVFWSTEMKQIKEIAARFQVSNVQIKDSTLK